MSEEKALYLRGVETADRVERPVYKESVRCIACFEKRLQPVLSLGEQLLTNFVADGRETEPLCAPLDVVRCVACGLLQLKNHVNPAILYGTEVGAYYWYRSSTSGVMRDHLRALMEEVAREADIGPRDILVDIGCNDAFMLNSFQVGGSLRVGFEPGSLLAQHAAMSGIYVFDSLFDGITYEATFNRRAQTVTAIAMFYDVPRPLEFLQDIERILDYRGIAVIEMNTLWDMVTNTAYDIIGHEHLAYWSLLTLSPLLEQAGLRPFRVQHFSINGGTTRLWLCHVNDPRVIEPEPSVKAQRDVEERDLTPENIAAFGMRASTEALRLHAWVEEEVKLGGKVFIWGASTRGRTIMQTSKIDGLISGASDIHPDKIGKTIAGTSIPIVHEDQARRDATAFIVLPYSYRADVLVKEAEFLKNGGKLVFPLPSLEVIAR